MQPCYYKHKARTFYTCMQKRHEKQHLFRQGGLLCTRPRHFDKTLPPETRTRGGGLSTAETYFTTRWLCLVFRTPNKTPKTNMCRTLAGVILHKIGSLRVTNFTHAAMKRRLLNYPPATQFIQSNATENKCQTSPTHGHTHTHTWLIAHSRAAASSRDCPPLRKFTPGIAAGMTRRRVVTVASPISFAVAFFLHPRPGLTMLGLRVDPSMNTPWSSMALYRWACEASRVWSNNAR